MSTFFSLKLLRKVITLHMARLFLTICKSGEQLLFPFQHELAYCKIDSQEIDPNFQVHYNPESVEDPFKIQFTALFAKSFRHFGSRNTKWKRQILTSDLNQLVFLYNSTQYAGHGDWK